MSAIGQTRHILMEHNELQRIERRADYPAETIVRPARMQARPVALLCRRGPGWCGQWANGAVVYGDTAFVGAMELRERHEVSCRGTDPPADPETAE